MSKKCQVTGKGPVSGYRYSIRGIAKKKKGIGLKVTGKTKRTFDPNVRTKRFWLPEEKRFVSLKIATSVMRTIDKKGISHIVRELRAKGQSV
jgi:large subunit ribosomal protein L28